MAWLSLFTKKESFPSTEGKELFKISKYISIQVSSDFLFISRHLWNPKPPSCQQRRDYWFLNGNRQAINTKLFTDESRMK